MTLASVRALLQRNSRLVARSWPARVVEQPAAYTPPVKFMCAHFCPVGQVGSAILYMPAYLPMLVHTCGLAVVHWFASTQGRTTYMLVPNWPWMLWPARRAKNAGCGLKLVVDVTEAVSVTLVVAVRDVEPEVEAVKEVEPETEGELELVLVWELEGVPVLEELAVFVCEDEAVPVIEVLEELEPDIVGVKVLKGDSVADQSSLSVAAAGGAGMG